LNGDRDAASPEAAVVWPGGYYEGDPLDPMGESTYGTLGYVSVLHAIYLTCIKPHVTSETRVVEIGPGRGAWTRTMLPASEIVAIDAVPADANGFWEYVGCHEHVRYLVDGVFDDAELPDGHFDYLFSFGCLCHLPPAKIDDYLERLAPKLRAGAKGFLMYADYAKANAARAGWKRLTVARALRGRRALPARVALRLTGGDRPHYPVYQESDDVPRPGRWYDLGQERMRDLLERHGYTVITPDVGC
jgi:phospholipid N-methyltransferase